MSDQITYQVEPLSSDPDSQVSETIGKMCYLAIEDSRNPYVTAIANQIAAKAASVEDLASGIFDEARKRLEFTLDNSVQFAYGNSRPKLLLDRGLELGQVKDVVEVLIRPVDVVLMSLSGAKVKGDCDDHAMFVCSLALALKDLGFQISNMRFVTVAADEGSTDFSHVYFVMTNDYTGKDIAIDASHGLYAGWEVPPSAITRKQEWPVSSSLLGFMLLGAGIIGYMLFGKELRFL